jgi:ribosome assembly protein YihI (activator of Der GTPase)
VTESQASKRQDVDATAKSAEKESRQTHPLSRRTTRAIPSSGSAESKPSTMRSSTTAPNPRVTICRIGFSLPVFDIDRTNSSLLSADTFLVSVARPEDSDSDSDPFRGVASPLDVALGNPKSGSHKPIPAAIESFAREPVRRCDREAGVASPFSSSEGAVGMIKTDGIDDIEVGEMGGEPGGEEEVWSGGKSDSSSPASTPGPVGAGVRARE